MRVADGYRRFIRAIAKRIEGSQPRLPNYDRACSDLGGVPWRRFEHTEQWFIPTPTANLPADSWTPSVEPIDLNPPTNVSLKPQLPLHVIVGAGGIVAVLALLAFVFTRAPSHHDVASASSSAAPVAAVAPVAPSAQPAIVSEPVAKHVKPKKQREHTAKRHLAKAHHRASASAHGSTIA
jgi:hypothetical protein